MGLPLPGRDDKSIRHSRVLSALLSSRHFVEPGPLVGPLLLDRKLDDQSTTVQDAVEYSLKAKTAEERLALKNAIIFVLLKGQEGVRNFKFYNPATWDMFKGMRLQCDNIAKIYKFETYKKLRNL